jgi:flagellar biosynthesis protein FliQ
MDWMPQAIREGIFTILFISGPLVILAAGLGLSVGIVQAATQVQEQTLGSAVKILGLFLAIIVFGFYMFGYMRDYTADNINRAFSIVPNLGTHVLPRRNFIDVPSNQELLKPLKSIPAPPIQEDSFKKAPTIADDLKSPDFEIKQGEKDNNYRIGLPEMQRKKIGDSNIIQQDSSGAAIREDEFRQDNNANFVSTPTTVAPAQATNTIISPASSTTTRPAQEAVRDNDSNQESLINNLGNEPVVRPRQRQRRSITDSLNKLRESIDEFNQDNKDTQGVLD